MSLVASLDWRLARQGQRQLPDFAGGRRFLSRKPEDRPAAEPADRCGRFARPLRTARFSKEESRATPFSIKRCCPPRPRASSSRSSKAIGPFSGRTPTQPRSIPSPIREKRQPGYGADERPRRGKVYFLTRKLVGCLARLTSRTGCQVGRQTRQVL